MQKEFLQMMNNEKNTDVNEVKSYVSPLDGSVIDIRTA